MEEDGDDGDGDKKKAMQSAEQSRDPAGIESVPLSPGNSQEGHRSPRSSAGGNRAWPAWLRLWEASHPAVIVPALHTVEDKCVDSGFLCSVHLRAEVVCRSDVVGRSSVELRSEIRGIDRLRGSGRPARGFVEKVQQQAIHGNSIPANQIETHCDVQQNFDDREEA
jgi:hypothetical protein